MTISISFGIFLFHRKDEKKVVAGSHLSYLDLSVQVILPYFGTKTKINGRTNYHTSLNICTQYHICLIIFTSSLMLMCLKTIV